MRAKTVYAYESIDHHNTKSNSCKLLNFPYYSNKILHRFEKHEYALWYEQADIAIFETHASCNRLIKFNSSISVTQICNVVPSIKQKVPRIKHKLKEINELQNITPF